MGAAGFVVDPPAEKGERCLVGRVDDDQLVLAQALKRGAGIVGERHGYPAPLQRLHHVFSGGGVDRQQQDPRSQAHPLRLSAQCAKLQVGRV